MKLEVKTIHKKYGKFEALKGFSYEFTPGVYGLLGPNGAGKSTLMNIIAGILGQTSGEITLDGKNINDLGKEYRKILGFLPQTSDYYKNFTAYEFLEYVAMLKGIADKTAAKKEIEKLLEQVNLSAVAHKKIGGFSGGMKQRVGIAQALLGNPQILIFDEPTAGLDPKERIRFRNIISELAFDKIVIMATHIVSDIELIANNILIIKEGTIISQGTIDECVSKLDGQVYQIEMAQKDFGEFAMNHKVVSVFRNSNESAKVRFISDTTSETDAKQVQPSLEDIYLYYFGD